MLKMNEEEACREIFARNANLNYTRAGGYNTGATLSTYDANEYIIYNVQRNIYCNPYKIGEHPPMGALYPWGSNGYLSTGTSGFCFLEVKGFPPKAEIVENIVTPAKMVAAVREAFMLTVSDAALVFKVSRPTIYHWETLDDMDQIRSRSYQNRIKELYRLSKAWAKLGPLTGRWLKVTLQVGVSVLDLLAAGKIDMGAILAAHKQIKSSKDRLRQAEHTRSLEAVQAMKSAFETLATKEKLRRKDSN